MRPFAAQRAATRSGTLIWSPSLWPPNGFVTIALIKGRWRGSFGATPPGQPAMVHRLWSWSGYSVREVPLDERVGTVDGERDALLRPDRGQVFLEVVAVLSRDLDVRLLTVPDGRSKLERTDEEVAARHRAGRHDGQAPHARASQV